MTLDDFLNHIKAGGALNTPEIYQMMDEMSNEARRITCESNQPYSHPRQVIRMIPFQSKLQTDFLTYFLTYYLTYSERNFQYPFLGGPMRSITLSDFSFRF